MVLRNFGASLSAAFRVRITKPGSTDRLGMTRFSGVAGVRGAQGVGDRPASPPGGSTVFVGLVPFPAIVSLPIRRGGSVTRVMSRVQAVSHGQSRGWCRITRRAEVATRHGTWTSLRRTVAVVALARSGAARAPAARVRLNAMTASASQAAFRSELAVTSVGGHRVMRLLDLPRSGRSVASRTRRG